MTSVTQWVASLLSHARIAGLRLRGNRIASSTHCAPGVEAVPGVAGVRRGEITIDEGCEMSRGVVLHGYGGYIRMSKRVFVGPYVVMYGHGGIEVGDHTLISMHCRILSANHTIPPIGTDIRSQPDVLLPTRIGRDVWLGAGVTVLGGVTIGDGCIVGAGAVVTHDLPPHSIAVGVPARVAGARQPAAGPSQET